MLVKYNQTVKRVMEGLEDLRYNTSIAALMGFVNTLRSETRSSAPPRAGLEHRARAARSRLTLAVPASKSRALTSSPLITI